MRSKIKTIPYAKETGNLIDNIRYYHKDIDWQPNDPFEAEMTFVSLTKLLDANGKSYPVFESDALIIIQSSIVRAGIVEKRWWHVRKQGQQYGLYPLIENA